MASYTYTAAPCPECGGCGEIESPVATNPYQGWGPTYRCENCEGSGRVETMTCDGCGETVHDCCRECDEAPALKVAA